MRVEVYRGSNHVYALTLEASALNLPADGAPWVHEGSSELSVVDGSFYGMDAQQALWDLTTQGFHLARLVDMLVGLAKSREPSH